MHTRRRLALLAPLLAFSASVLASDPQQAADQLMEQLQAGQFEQAQSRFTPEMAKAVPAASLQQIWQALAQQLGALQHVQPATASALDKGHQRLSNRLQFASGAVVATTVVNAAGQIAGFHLAPAAVPASAVAADAPYTERSLQLDHGPGPLGATLSLPKGPGPFPAVILVHGTGPQDRDQSVGPNKPFADIARGLAAQGIAALRYDKRTQARPQDFADGVSLERETINDAIAAVALLKTQPGIAADKVYVIGHSQGGMLASRIANASGAAGTVMLASPARPILTLLREQNVYLLAQTPDLDPAAAKAHLAQLDAQIQAVRGNPAATLMNLPGSYWQQVEAIDPVADTRASGLPTLLLQGGRDFQVIDTDWQRLKDGLRGERYTFHHYPTLNHLGIAGSGAGSLAEYQQPGTVAQVLIDDLATWIHAR